MNLYLAAITARSAQDDAQSLTTTTAVPTVLDEKSTVAEKDNFRQIEFNQQSLEPDQSYPIHPIKNSIIKNEIPLSEKSSGQSYFSSHTERLNNSESGSAFQNNLYETKGIRFEKPSHKITSIADPVSLNKIESTFNAKTGLNTLLPKKEKENQTTNVSPELLAQRTIPGQPSISDGPSKSAEINETTRSVIEQKQFMAPSMELLQNVNKLISNKTGIAQITPNMEVNENNQLIQNKKQLATPKLVIGKIIVEVLPPIATVPPKIITKVVSQTSMPISLKSNKLIFGLGQM